MTSPWREVGDRVWVRRYESLDQTIGAIGGAAGLAVIDTRANHRLADELRDDLRQLSGEVIAVVNTHGHWDHVFGNARFAPLPIWGHVRCVDFIAATGEAARARLIESDAGDADAFREVVLTPPTEVFETSATLDLGDRQVELRYLGRGHTDNDVVVVVPDASSSSPAICSRTRRRPASATASRSTGPRPGEPCWSWSTARSCPATATRSIGPSRSARSASWRRWRSSRATRSAERSASTRRFGAPRSRPT